MATRKQIIQEARSWIDTPYQHQGRIKGIACDCIGLIIGVRKALGLRNYDIDGYNRFGKGVEILSECDRNLIPVENASHGDILVFTIRRYPTHLAFLATDGSYPTIIHAYQNIKAVKEHALGHWEKLIVGKYSLIDGKNQPWN